MRPWTAPLAALTLLVAGPLLGSHAAAESDHGVAPSAQSEDHGAAGKHAPPEHAPTAASPAKGHGDAKGHAKAKGHAEAKAPKKPAGPGQVGLTAALVLLLVGSGVGGVALLREQLS